MPPDKQEADAIEGPPFLKTWKRVYGAVLTYLVILLTVLFLITKAFRY